MNGPAQTKDFCPNPACPDYSKLQRDTNHSNLNKLGHTPHRVQRYQCKTCGKTFTEAKTILFFRKHASTEQIIEVLTLLADPGPAQPGLGGNRISTLTRVKGIKKDTILRWVREAGQHMDELNAVLIRDFHLLKRWEHPDGWGGIDEAILVVYRLVPEYSGRGQPPTRPKPRKDWRYLQIVKQRDENGNLHGLPCGPFGVRLKN
jgi:transposase-like protein